MNIDQVTGDGVYARMPEKVGLCGCVLVRTTKGLEMKDCALHAAAPELLAYLKESHQNEIDENHYGDGPEGCTYCELIAKAEGK